MKTTLKLVGISFFFLFSFNQGNAQTEFAKVYFEEYEALQSSSVVNANDGSYIIAGNRNNKSFLLKSDSTGEILWNKSFEPFSTDEHANITSLFDSTFLFVSGIFISDKGHTVLLCVNIDTDGDTNWIRSIDLGISVYPYSVEQTLDSGFIIAGYVYENGLPNRIVVIKLDNLATLQWSKVIQGAYKAHYAYSVKQTADTGYIIAGYVADWGRYSSNGYLLKLTSSGEISWSNTYELSSSNDNKGLAVIVLDDGYLLGMLTSSHLIMMKTDLSGNVLWAKNYNVFSMGFEILKIKIQKTTDGRFAVLARDALTKIDSSGNVLWSKGFMMYVADVVESTDKGFFIVGNGPLIGVKKYITDDPQIGVAKTDSLGQNSSECIFDANINVETETATSNAITFTSEAIGAMSQVSIQLSSASIVAETGCVAFVGAVNEEVFEDNVQIFPNPSSGIFTIQTTNGEQLSGIEVFNAFGEQVYQIDGLEMMEIAIDLSTNSRGIYFLKLTVNGKKYSRKIVLF